MKVYIDFEANGVSQPQEIISIGAITENGGVFYSLVQPHSLLDKKIKEFTHISQRAINEAPTIEDVMEDFQDWIDACGGDKFLVYGNTDRKFIETSRSKTFDKATIGTLNYILGNLENVESKISPKFHMEHISLYSAYLTMCGLSLYDLQNDHNALFDAKTLKYVCEHIEDYELPNDVEPVKVPKVELHYGKSKSKGAALTGSRKARARQAEARCPEITSKKFNIKVKATKGYHRSVIFNSLHAALTLIPHSFATAEDKLAALEFLYNCTKTGKPANGWILEEVI